MHLAQESLYEASKLLISKLSSYSEYEREQVMTALYAAAEFHGRQKRKTGIPYIVHPIEVASVVAGTGADVATVCAALLHDTLEDTKATPDDIRQRFDEEVYGLVEAVTRLPMFSQREFFEKIYEKAKRDVRVAVIKLADQYANNRGENQLVFSKDKHQEHLDEMEHFYLDQLATIPDIPKELVKMVRSAQKESLAAYQNRHF